MLRRPLAKVRVRLADGTQELTSADKLTWHYRDVGAALLVSAQPEAVGAAQKAALKTAFAQAANVQPVGEPLDWLATPQPTRWRLAGQLVDFDWS